MPRNFNVKCVKQLSAPTHIFNVYRGVEVDTYEIFTVYEWRLNFGKKKAFEGKDGGLDKKEKKDDDNDNDIIADDDCGNEYKLNFRLQEVR